MQYNIYFYILLYLDLIHLVDSLAPNNCLNSSVKLTKYTKTGYNIDGFSQRNRNSMTHSSFQLTFNIISRFNKTFRFGFVQPQNLIGPFKFQLFGLISDKNSTIGNIFILRVLSRHFDLYINYKFQY